MNIFRFIADMLHLAAILTLLYRIKVSRNVVGKSSPSHPSQLLIHVSFFHHGIRSNILFYLTWTPLSMIATSMVSQHLADHLFTPLVTKLFREKSAEDGGLGQ